MCLSDVRNLLWNSQVKKLSEPCARTMVLGFDGEESVQHFGCSICTLVHMINGGCDVIDMLCARAHL